MFMVISWIPGSGPEAVGAEVGAPRKISRVRSAFALRQHRPGIDALTIADDARAFRKVAVGTLPLLVDAQAQVFQLRRAEALQLVSEIIRRPEADDFHEKLSLRLAPSA